VLQWVGNRQATDGCRRNYDLGWGGCPRSQPARGTTARAATAATTAGSGGGRFCRNDCRGIAPWKRKSNREGYRQLVWWGSQHLAWLTVSVVSMLPNDENVQFGIMRYNAQWGTVLFFCTALHLMSELRHRTALHCTAQHCTTEFCIHWGCDDVHGSHASCTPSWQGRQGNFPDSLLVEVRALVADPMIVQFSI